MKVAYLLLVHKDPLLLERTIEALSSKSCGFFVHVDRKTVLEPFSASKPRNVFVSKERIPVYWGEFSQVEATLLLMQQALAARESYDCFVFLQGGTYPLRSSEYIESFLENNRDRQFMNLAKMPAPGYPLSKINTLRYPSHKPVRRFVMRALAKLGAAQRDYRKHLGELEPYAGHACWAITREACQYAMDFAASHPDVRAYFEDTFAPDESFFHTIIGNSPFREDVHKTLVYADWSDSAGYHPAMLDEEQIRFFETQDKVWSEDEWGAGEMLFARKFSDQRLDLVDRVEEMKSRKDNLVSKH